MAWRCFRCLHCDSPTAACHKLNTTSFFTADNTSGSPRSCCQRQGCLQHSLDVLYIPFLHWALLKARNLSCHLVPIHGIYLSLESEDPTRHSASLLVVESEKYNNLSRSLDSWKRYWHAKPLNIHEAYLSPFIVCVPYQVLQHTLYFIIIQSD